ncbi:MAG: hypothetical protein IJ400_03080 [Clostridia bacterium]|nr:hypothetical protein [Clostridia bacterium]
MFGYIKPYVPVLRVKENELYKATYCGLCKAMGKNTGCMSNFTLSYDFVFLALLRMGLANEGYELKMSSCVAHPFKKTPMLLPNQALEYSAKSSVILTKLKLKDNINDSRGLSRLKAKITGVVSIFLKKTDKNLEKLEKEVNQWIKKLSQLEHENIDSIDKCAHTFGMLLSEIIAFNLEGPIETLARGVGYHLGKWIYVADAYDDFYKDKKSGSFNPLVNFYGEELDENARELIKSSMLLELNEMSSSIELIDFCDKDIEEIVKNIVYLGLPREFDEITKRHKNKKNVEE